MINLLKVIKSVYLMLLSSKNDESDGIKTFEGLFFLYHASQLHLQTNKNVNLCYGLYRRKSVTF